jgi:hypothetical protein
MPIVLSTVSVGHVRPYRSLAVDYLFASEYEKGA